MGLWLRPGGLCRTITRAPKGEKGKRIMKEKQFKVTFVTKVALLIAAFWTMADMFVVTPLLDTIAGVYPESSGLAINLLYCLSQGTIIIGSLFVSFMSTKMSKKTMMLLGGFLVLIFGSFGGMIPGVPMMLVFRGIEGVGAGICITLIPTLINELFQDEKERNMLIGVQAAVGCVCGAAVAALSGVIAEKIGWRYSYFIYFFSIIIIVLIAIGVPKTPVDAPAAKGEKQKLNGASWGIFVMAILFGLFSSALFGYASYIVAETGMGGSAVAGYSNSFIQIGSFIGSMAMAGIYAKCKGYIEPIGWLAMCLGGVIFMVAAVLLKAPVVAYIGCLCFGFSNGLLFPWLYAKAAIVCAPGTDAKTIATANIGYYIGMFGAVFFYEAMLNIFKTTSLTTVYFMIVVTAIYTVIEIISNVARHGELVKK